MKDLTEIASVSGKGGLFKILKPGRAGVILESLDGKNTKLVTNPNHKVSVLGEISIYTNTEEGAIPLEDVLQKIFKEFGEDPGVDNKSASDELMSFIEYIVPEYDTDRVYPSDIKKLVSWYYILLREAPELLKKKEGDKKEKKEETPVKGQPEKSAKKAPKTGIQKVKTQKQSINPPSIKKTGSTKNK